MGIMNSFKTRTIRLRSVRVVVDEDVRVAVDNNVRGRVEVDEEQSGFPEKKIRLVSMNSFRTRTNLERSVRVVVRFGSLETIRSGIMNSFKTRTIWLRSVRVVVDEDVRVAVDNNVRGRVEVDEEQSGFPETIRWVSMNSFRTRTNFGTKRSCSSR